MEARAFAEFGNGVWCLFASLADVSLPVLKDHWLIAICLLFLAAYMAANILMAKKMHGSLAETYRQEGPKEFLFILFLGVPWVVGAFCKLLSPEDGEEE